jgi:hypothetical protein
VSTTPLFPLTGLSHWRIHNADDGVIAAKARLSEVRYVEHHVAPVQPAAGQRIGSKDCRGKQIVGGPDPSAN